MIEADSIRELERRFRSALSGRGEEVTTTASREAMNAVRRCGLMFTYYLDVSARDGDAGRMLDVRFRMTDDRDADDWSEETRQRNAFGCLSYARSGTIALAEVTDEELKAWVGYLLGRQDETFITRDRAKRQHQAEKKKKRILNTCTWGGALLGLVLGVSTGGGVWGAVVGAFLGYVLGAIVGSLVVSWYLRNGIHELRVAMGGVNYRMLYFFFGTAAAVVSHGLTKGQAVPAREIDVAIRRKDAFTHDPATHTYEEQPQ